MNQLRFWSVGLGLAMLLSSAPSFAQDAPVACARYCDAGRKDKVYLADALAGYGLENKQYFAGKPEVIDGDTLMFGGEMVRLWGIQAPDIDSWPGGPWARATLEEEVAYRQIECVEIDRDPDGQLLAACADRDGFIPRLPLMYGMVVPRSDAKSIYSPLYDELIRKFQLSASIAENLIPMIERLQLNQRADVISRVVCGANSDCEDEPPYDVRAHLSEYGLVGHRFFEGPAETIDGETIRIGDEVIRLWGVATPDIESKPWGPWARTALAEEIGDGPVQCVEVVEDLDGRPLALCANESWFMPYRPIQNGLAVLRREHTLNAPTRADDWLRPTWFKIFDDDAPRKKRGVWHGLPDAP